MQTRKYLCLTFDSESQGSMFQKNAAAFYDMDAPATGERPFNIPKTIPKTGGPAAPAQKGSVLNEMRLKEHVILTLLILLG